ncbi:F0F1 ATP synthase subunit delta [Desulforhopalus sp. IMCC35007]|uniref:F0F1 ATP synthase subunit delta n=1 Tax=Desulforhopalus sp. IMCC35007 TaxID=2569543 RepID=UPI0010ADEFFD|nr:F0F1 ATP synthase subunit delta [Desulforhopalus sp. IMCC35007]TKB07004.1 F0F1 ATP synthase subunit B [Desulforhopalus sp. IMCC35007]
MLIDWFTVIAQLINFLVLVGLMKRFLFKPILKAIDAREKRIALALADADLKKTEALQEKIIFENKNSQFNQQRQQLLETATRDANIERQRLFTDAQQAAEDFRARRQVAWLQEQQSIKEEILSRTREEVFAISRKALSELADTGLEQRMIDVFSDHLHSLGKKQKTALTGSLQNSPGQMHVRSAFELSPEQQSAIQQTLTEMLPSGLNESNLNTVNMVSFVVDPQLICGIELTIGGQKLAWSIHDYLSSLEERVSDVLLQQTAKKSDAAMENLQPASPTAEPDTAVTF